MKRLGLVFSRQWSVICPPVARYLEDRYVDEFFDRGTLRLSSFKAFRNRPDEERGDPMEGRINAELSGPNSEAHSIIAVNGQAAFVLCAGLTENARMEASFSTEAGIRIIDTLAFADAISTHIPGFVGGVQGNCIYREDTLLKKRTARSIGGPPPGQDPEAWADQRFIADETLEAFFIKRLRYAHQNEYRFVWFAHGPEKGELFVTCPEAAKLCERI